MPVSLPFNRFHLATFRRKLLKTKRSGHAGINFSCYAKMFPYLTNEQMLHLRDALSSSIAELRQQPENMDDLSSNEDGVKAFWDAKRIEGCSEKTLKYYGSTIHAMLGKIGKSPLQISTNDLRAYLIEYQTQRGASKVTIDNIRQLCASSSAI